MKTNSLVTKSFWQDTVTYACQVKLFKKEDWVAYIAWVGLMFGLLFSVSFFVLFGWYKGVEFPPYVWNVPIGVFVFVVAIAFDTIGHRTAYKEELKKGEALVHHITIFAGITSVLALCLAYDHPSFWRYPAFTLISLAVFYSIIDEAMHWRRYLSQYSDRVEMWSHFFIFVGHVLMSISWWHWFDEGYPGVKETFVFLGW